MQQFKKYNEKAEYSYTFGPFPTFELIENRPEKVIKVIWHSDLSDEIRDKLADRCKKAHILCENSDKLIAKIRDKDNCLVVGIFEKYEEVLKKGEDHIVLVNPSDMGNLGTIIRTAVGFGVQDLAIIRPGAHILNPKVVRSSMGAMFKLRFRYFDSFKEYRDIYGEERDCYPFMLTGAVGLDQLRIDETRPWSLIFGNEASGLPESFAKVGKSVLIRHTNAIDSLNLSLAAGIGIYEFTKVRCGEPGMQEVYR